MTEFEEIDVLLKQLTVIQSAGIAVAVKKPKEALESSAQDIAKAASGSWLGYHARVYFHNLEPPPPGHHFSVEWGLRHPFHRPVSNDWREFRDEDVQALIRERAGSPDLGAAEDFAQKAEETFEAVKEEALAILRAALTLRLDPVLEKVAADVDSVKVHSAHEYVTYFKPKGSHSTRDTVVINQGIQVPPHIKIGAEIFELDAALLACKELNEGSAAGNATPQKKLVNKREG